MNHRIPCCPAGYAISCCTPLCLNKLVSCVSMSEDERITGNKRGDKVTVMMEMKPASVGWEKAVEACVINAPVLEQTEKHTKFQQVAAGVRPHDGGALSTPVKTGRVGEKAVCTQCGHT
jgi:hypothetical protein